MSKTKELLIVAFFVSLGILYNVLHAEETNAAPIEQKCYKNEEFMKNIDEKKMITVFNGSNGNKTVEVLFGTDRYMYIVQYDTNKDGNAMVAKEYCVTNILKDVNFNENAVEILHDALEKLKGQKT